MRQLNITVESEDINTSQELIELFQSNHVELSRLNPAYRNYSLNFIPHASTTLNYYSRNPMYYQKPAFDIKLRYSFADYRSHHELDDFKELEAFAYSYENFVRSRLGSSSEYMGRVSVSALQAIKNEREYLCRLAQQDRENWRDKQHPPTSYNYTPILFRTDYHSQRKARVELASAVVLTLIGLPLFFIEPITASFLLLAAAFLYIAASYHREQANQFAVSLV
ncbi:hypothetical protein [Legionella drozanskii]|uniref:Uncharacterized protein n=1 Tax=Legionella drozanskii LLAP-1 TaxID=1212489 RepID=A0A0W0TBS2_9GAMM|nr:hypothetical protein [Legionella drozanskii]KTC93041.1 hypothetical protein Ldro_0412 [Legionella drozanskii LLAP-1]